MYINPYLQQPYDPMAQYRQQYMQAQQIQPAQPMQPVPMQSPNQDERIWVQGEGAAQAYLVAPNSFVRLWDSTKKVFYEKRADASGIPSMIIYDYAQRSADAPIEPINDNIGSNTYTEEINALKAKINALEERMGKYESESYDDDTAVYGVPEELPRQPTRRSTKAGQPR